MSPFLEYAMAAQWAGYRQDEFFEKLSTRWQAHVIAVYRLHSQMEAVVMHAERQEAQRKANKGRGRRMV